MRHDTLQSVALQGILTVGGLRARGQTGQSSIRGTGNNQLRLWIASQPEVPEGEWYKDFGSFKIGGEGRLPKTFLLKGQAARGQAL
jgi:hypothetical protein